MSNVSSVLVIFVVGVISITAAGRAMSAFATDPAAIFSESRLPVDIKADDVAGIGYKLRESL